MEGKYIARTLPGSLPLGVALLIGTLNMQENRATVWDNANVLSVPVGSTSDDLRYLKSISLHLWLFGYELPGNQKAPLYCCPSA